MMDFGENRQNPSLTDQTSRQMWGMKMIHIQTSLCMQVALQAIQSNKSQWESKFTTSLNIYNEMDLVMAALAAKPLSEIIMHTTVL